MLYQSYVLGWGFEHVRTFFVPWFYVVVSWNRATPKSSTLMGLSILNHPFGGSLFMEHPMLLPQQVYQNCIRVLGSQQLGLTQHQGLDLMEQICTTIWRNKARPNQAVLRERKKCALFRQSMRWSLFPVPETAGAFRMGSWWSQLTGSRKHHCLPWPAWMPGQPLAQF